MGSGKTKKLGELPATAICGNDITSSVLYVSSLTIIAAGQYAWISLLIVAGVLYLFRKIYGEVVGALPLNGGAYNALLNTTSKSVASIAATLTLLSYMATAVISASEAMHYLHSIVPALPIVKLVSRINRKINDVIERITSQEFVFFTRGDNLPNLNKVLLYIKKNEHTKKIKIVTVQTEKDEELCRNLHRDIEFLDREYPVIDIEYIELTGTFGPELIRKLSEKWHIPVNFMFIGSPGNHFPYRIEELGGVRLII